MSEQKQLVSQYVRGQISRRVFFRRLVGTGVTVAAASRYVELLRPSPAAAATKLGNGFYHHDVYAEDDSYSDFDSHTSVTRAEKRGDSIGWELGPGSAGHQHTVTDASGMGYFDSGYMRPVRSVYNLILPAAGTYRYHCKESDHLPMTGKVVVPVGVNPVSAPKGSQFSIIWSVYPVPDGYVFDVQLRRPGQAQFHEWKTATMNRKGTFTPSAKGEHVFRARLRNTANGNHSGWSPGRKITAT
jgi:hypothetical protein